MPDEMVEVDQTVEGIEDVNNLPEGVTVITDANEFVHPDNLSYLTDDAKTKICQLIYGEDTSDGSYLTDEARIKLSALIDPVDEAVINGLIEDNIAKKWIKSVIFDGSELTEESFNRINMLLDVKSATPKTTDDLPTDNLPVPREQSSNDVY